MPALQINNVVKSFDGRRALDGVSIDLREREVDQSPHSRELVAALHRATALNVLEAPKDTTQKFDAASATAYVRGGKAPEQMVGVRSSFLPFAYPM